MQRLAKRLEDNPWRVAITHGDYHPNNLIWDGQVLTGIDIGGSASLPIYKDMARSLVHLARRNVLGGDSQSFGVSKTLLNAYSDSFELTQTELDVAVPFYIGFECLIKVEQPDAPKWRIKAAERMYDGFLEEF